MTAEYHRRWRAANPDLAKANQRRNVAQRKALARLGHLYPEELKRLYEQVCHEDGIDPHPPRGRPRSTRKNA